MVEQDVPAHRSPYLREHARVVNEVQEVIVPRHNVRGTLGVAGFCRTRFHRGIVCLVDSGQQAGGLLIAQCILYEKEPFRFEVLAFCVRHQMR